MSAFRILSSSVLLGVSKATVAAVALHGADDDIEDADEDTGPGGGGGCRSGGDSDDVSQ